MRNRPGATSLPELVLVAWLFGLVLAGVARFAADQNRLAALQRDRIRFEEAVRTGTVILGGELRALAPGDVSAAAADSIRLRAFRGGGRVCDSDGESIWTVFEGVRRPDPARDSVLLLAAGEAEVRVLESYVRSDHCGGSLRLFVVGAVPEGASYALVFETGVYLLVDGAVRYRRGEGGRQPLTEAVLGGMAFRYADGGVRVRLGADPDSLPRLTRPIRWFDVPTLNLGIVP